jgi:hypothetical protein
VDITQWDFDNSTKRQILHVKLALAKAELKTFQFLVSETKQKIVALNDEFAAIPENAGFTTTEIKDAAQ